MTIAGKTTQGITITKADGTVEPFKSAKLRRSLKRAGASAKEIGEITQAIESELPSLMTTDAIYRRAFDLLRAYPEPIAARYSLRRALFGLGPTGFPFEDYLASLFKTDGYKTRTRVLVQGKCVAHEIDLIAYRPEDCLVAEAKFHLHPGTKSDIQTVLYSQARFEDLKGHKVGARDACGIKSGYVITNTKFTKIAIDYAECVGLKLISWDYPKERTLQAWIEETKLYPVTVLSSLTPREKSQLLTQGTVLCTDVLDNHSLLSAVGISGKKIHHVLNEGARLCQI